MCARRYTSKTSVVFPLLLIGFGLLMLAWRWLPDFYPWHVIGRFWPLGLILIGAGMIFDRSRDARSLEERPFPIGSTLGAVAFLLVMALLIARDHSSRPVFMHSAAEGRQSHETKTVERGAAQAVNMTVNMPSGELRFSGGGDPLLKADFYYDGSWSEPEVNYSVADGRGDLTISQMGGSHVGHSDNTWDLQVNDATPIELKVDMGAGRGDFHMAKVNLTRMEFNIGAGQVTVDLTGERARDVQAVLHGGVGQAVIRLPRNVGVVATVHGGLGSIDVHGLKKEDSNYVNDAYGKSPQTIHLSVEGGIGQIKLEQE